MTILVAMHVGTHAILISDKLSFTGADGPVKSKTFNKQFLGENFASVTAGSVSLMHYYHKFLKDKTLTGETELRNMSEFAINDFLKEYGACLPYDMTMMFVAATVDEKARLFTVVQDELWAGGRLKELTDHQPGAILFQIPRSLAEHSESFKLEATQVFQEFMEGPGKKLRQTDTQLVAQLARSIGTVLNRIAIETSVISTDYDVSVVSSNGQILSGRIDFECPRNVTLVQRAGQKVVADAAGLVV